MFFAKEESSWTNCIRGLAGRGAVGSATAATLLIGFFRNLTIKEFINEYFRRDWQIYFWEKNSSILNSWNMVIGVSTSCICKTWQSSREVVWQKFQKKYILHQNKSPGRNIYCSKTFEPSTEVTSEKWADKSLGRNIFAKTVFLGEGWTLIRLLRRGEEMVWRKLKAHRKFEKRIEVADRIPVTFWLAVCCFR